MMKRKNITDNSLDKSRQSKNGGDRSYLDRSSRSGANQGMAGSNYNEKERKVELMADIQNRLRNGVRKEFQNLNSVEQESLMKTDVFLNAN